MERVGTVAAIRTELCRKSRKYEYCVSHVVPNHCSQEELVPNVEPPTMKNTQWIQLDASHNEITEWIIATVDQSTNT